ncbi:YdcF family protein [Paenibacillus sp. 7124]|uniref:YdcF family protein n=1 Tax=Paenibacillus apii TaxID=1850370 RepID=A0A6M1PJF8_9BACL|nr:YdcF family protein [Paenibacillus apii]NGM83569.1 YdcF family protein [Paenibacillus apii]
MKNTNNKKNKRSKLKYPICLLVFIFLTILCAGRFLVVAESPKNVNAIIVLSGGAGRVEKAVDLYKAGYAPYLVLSNYREGASSSGNMLQTTLTLGVPAEAIFTENKALSTYDNAALTLPIMKEHGFTSAIVVSSDFHMRRVKFIFDHVYKKSGIELTYVSSVSGYDAKRWWSRPYSRGITFSEYAKMVGNLFRYRGPEAKKTLDQIKGWFR